MPFDLNSLSRPEKKKRLCADLELHNNPILDAEPAQRDRLQELATNYHQIFTDGMSCNAGSMPSVPFISARVMLDPEKGPHTPHRATVRVLNPVQRAGLEGKIKTWLNQKIIEESASPWSFPIISVIKKRRAGQTIPEYCFCADLRILNSKVIKDNLYTGSVPANLALLEKHNIYSALDLFNAFKSCELEPTSRICLHSALHWDNNTDTAGYLKAMGTRRQLCLASQLNY